MGTSISWTSPAIPLLQKSEQVRGFFDSHCDVHCTLCKLVWLSLWCANYSLHDVALPGGRLLPVKVRIKLGKKDLLIQNNSYFFPKALPTFLLWLLLNETIHISPLSLFQILLAMICVLVFVSFSSKLIVKVGSLMPIGALVGGQVGGLLMSKWE